MRRNCLCSLSMLLLWGCAHQGQPASEAQGPASITAPFSEKVPTAMSLDADGNGVLTQGDAEWFGMVVEALGDAPEASTLHYAGLKAPAEVWAAIGFGTSVPAVDKLPGLSTAERYGLSVDAGYAQKARCRAAREIVAQGWREGTHNKASLLPGGGSWDGWLGAPDIGKAQRSSKGASKDEVLP